MASKRQMGYKCRIAGVMIFLLASIAALVAVAVIQDAWASKEYTLEVNKTHTHTHAHTQDALDANVRVKYRKFSHESAWWWMDTYVVWLEHHSIAYSFYLSFSSSLVRYSDRFWFIPFQCVRVWVARGEGEWNRSGDRDNELSGFWWVTSRGLMAKKLMAKFWAIMR